LSGKKLILPDVIRFIPASSDDVSDHGLAVVTSFGPATVAAVDVSPSAAVLAVLEGKTVVELMFGEDSSETELLPASAADVVRFKGVDVGDVTLLLATVSFTDKNITIGVYIANKKLSCCCDSRSYWRTIKPVPTTSLGLRTAGTQSDSSG